MSINIHIGNEYYFSIIFPGKTNDFYDTLYFRKYTFNSSSKSLTSSTDISFATKDNKTNNNNNYDLTFYNSFSCKLMIHNNKNVINCIYGNSDKYVSTIFDPYNNFNTINSLPSRYIDSNLKLCKIEVIPEEREKAIVCVYHDGMKFACRIYDILTNSFGDENII